jgi:ketosteroid isomerase-like protein
MTSPEIELIVEALGDPEIASGAPVDMVELFARPDTTARLERTIDPEAVIEFPTPDGSFMGGMAGPFRGAAGLQTAWAEWLEPWDSFVFRATEWIEPGGGRVLMLGDSTSRLVHSTVELDAHVAALWTIRDGRVVAIEHFLDQDQARRAAGLT